MSSQLTTLVPVLDGTNYQQWASSMRSYLQSQRVWKCVKAGAKPPPETIDTTQTNEKGESFTTSTDNSKEVSDWEEKSEQALGIIRLRLHHTISYQYNAEDDPEALWKTLSEKYRDPGVSGAFVEFKGVMDTVIPNNGDPSPALDKMMSHFVRLDEMNWVVPKNIQAMIILAKAPPSMESMVQIMAAQVKEEKDKSKITPDVILGQMRLSWDTHARTGAKNKQNQQQSNKISAVHDGSGQPPSFQQQQQQRGE
jgi:hypothetical protein